MKNFSCLLLCLILLSGDGTAQFRDWKVKLGFSGSLLFPENEYANLGFSGNDNFSFDWYRTSLLGEAFAGFELSRLLELRLSAGYGHYAGNAVFKKGTDYGYYESSIVPITLQLRVTPFESAYWNPYFYAGGGVMKYTLEKNPDVISPAGISKDGWTAHIPVGFGAEFIIYDGILLDFSAGGALSSARDLDAYNSENSSLWDAYLNTSLGLTFTWENCRTDDDMDRLGKCDENTAGTDPRNPDTDDDGLTDGEEYHSYRTNPLKADTDGDGLTDGMEVLNVKSNPFVSDTDNDGLNDFEESGKRTNPLKADTDRDGLSDGFEVSTSMSSPLLADTDGDGLSDSDEFNKYKTDPNKEDTDTDGLTDAEEVLKQGTDPLKKDTDGGTVNDLVEVVRGSDPKDPGDDVVEMDTPVVLDGINFESGKWDIKPESERVLEKVLKTLNMHKDIVVQISGHTDDVGSVQANQRLSEKRAKAVRDWLISKGIDGRRIIAAGYGTYRPRVPNDTPEHRKMNRRIEFKRVL